MSDRYMFGNHIAKETKSSVFKSIFTKILEADYECKKEFHLVVFVKNDRDDKIGGLIFQNMNTAWVDRNAPTQKYVFLGIFTGRFDNSNFSSEEIKTFTTGFLKYFAKVIFDAYYTPSSITLFDRVRGTYQLNINMKIFALARRGMYWNRSKPRT